MSIPLKDVKLLWGRSGNRCAICRREVSEDKIASSDAYPLGEQAHIVAEEAIGPRGESTLSLDERNRYHNLILLCPTDHTISTRIRSTTRSKDSICSRPSTNFG